MAWISSKRRAELEAIEKASRAPTGSRDASDLVTMMVRATGQDMDRDSRGSPLFRPDEWVNSPYGPSWPLEIDPLDERRPDTGLPDPRQYQYPVSENLRYFSSKTVPWRTLKDAADSPLFRACIEIKKAELTTLDWKIRVSPDAAEEIARQSRKSKADVETELRERYKEEIDRLTDFWSVPDRRNGRDFGEWLSIALEEQLVWDAIAIYPRRTYGGQLLDLTLIDGSTIKPLLAEDGSRPEPPAPAYQQILYGFPRGEFTADTVDQHGQLVVPGGLLATQLIYRRRVPRLQTPYGFSPTEQALLDGLLYNKRFEWMMSEYTQGTQTTGWVKIPETSSYTARQILNLEREFNDRYAGMTAERFRHPFMPPGFELMPEHSVDERYKADYDMHLIRLVAMHFGLTITELGFTEKGGLGSSGYHEGQQDIQFRKGLLPDTRWFGNMLTEISRNQLNMPKELEFAFLGLDDEDEAAADQVNENRVKSARMTPNEARRASGQPAVDIPEADMLQLQTARGIVFLDGASKLAPAGVMIEPASEEAPGGDSGVGGPKPASPTQRRPVASVSNTAKSADDVTNEIRKFRKWAKGTQAPSRPFSFAHLTPELAKDLLADWPEDKLAKWATFAKADDADPKAPWSPYSSLG